MSDSESIFFCILALNNLDVLGRIDELISQFCSHGGYCTVMTNFSRNDRCRKKHKKSKSNQTPNMSMSVLIKTVVSPERLEVLHRFMTHSIE